MDSVTKPVSVWAFTLWSLVGAVFAFGLAALMSIGIFVLPVAVIGLVVLARRRGVDASMAGLICGAGLIPLYIAWLNRDGPGTVCTSTASGGSCTDEYSPLPFLVIGLALIAVGVVVFRRRRGAR